MQDCLGKLADYRKSWITAIGRWARQVQASLCKWADYRTSWNTRLFAAGLSKSRQGYASGLTSGYPGIQAISRWARQIQASLGKWADTRNPGIQAIGSWAKQIQASLGNWADNLKSWNTGYWQLGQASLGRSRQGLTTRNRGIQAIRHVQASGLSTGNPGMKV